MLIALCPSLQNDKCAFLLVFCKWFKRRVKFIAHHCENLQSVSVQIRSNPKVNLRLNSWIAALKRLVRSETLTKIQPIFFKKGLLKFNSPFGILSKSPKRAFPRLLARRGYCAVERGLWACKIRFRRCSCPCLRHLAL